MICPSSWISGEVSYLKRSDSTKRRGWRSTELHKFSFRFCNFPILSMFWILEKRKRCCQVGQGGSFCNSISLCNFVSRGWSWKALSFNLWCNFWNGETCYTISDFFFSLLWVCKWRPFIYTYSYFLLYWSL